MAANVEALPDSATLRTYFSKVLSALAWLAKFTTTVIDDTVVAAMASVVANDAAWDLFYSIIGRLVADGRDGESEFISAEAAAFHAHVPGIPIATIIMLIQLALAIWRGWKKDPVPVPISNTL